MELKLLRISGLDIAYKAMRNPMKSWHKATPERDRVLLEGLLNGGDEESKILRFPEIYCEWVLPRSVWAEIDTYKIGFDMMSESTMHRLMIDGVNLDDFEFDQDDLEETEYFLDTCNYINRLVKRFQQEKDVEKRNKLREKAKNALPEGFLQKRTIKMNVQTARRIWRQRHNHRLPVWHIICDWIADLPEIGWMITYEPKPKAPVKYRIRNKNTGEIERAVMTNTGDVFPVLGTSFFATEIDVDAMKPEDYYVEWIFE